MANDTLAAFGDVLQGVPELQKSVAGAVDRQTLRKRQGAKLGIAQATEGRRKGRYEMELEQFELLKEKMKGMKNAKEEMYKEMKADPKYAAFADIFPLPKEYGNDAKERDRYTSEVANAMAMVNEYNNKKNLGLSISAPKKGNTIDEYKKIIFDAGVEKGQDIVNKGKSLTQQEAFKTVGGGPTSAPREGTAFTPEMAAESEDVLTPERLPGKPFGTEEEAFGAMTGANLPPQVMKTLKGTTGLPAEKDVRSQQKLDLQERRNELINKYRKIKAEGQILSSDQLAKEILNATKILKGTDETKIDFMNDKEYPNPLWTISKNILDDYTKRYDKQKAKELKREGNVDKDGTLGGPANIPTQVDTNKDPLGLF